MDISDFEKRLIEYLKGKKFSSPEDLIQAIMRFIHIENQTPLEEFCGLSPYKMTRLLYFPFNSPDVVSFNLDVPPPLEAPFVKLFILLINGIHNAGVLKATAKGNLPRDFCRELEKHYLSEEELKFLSRDRFPIMREHDFLELHKVRVIAEMSGYMKNYEKKFILTGRGKKLIKNGFTMDDYFHLFKTFTWKYNWAYFDFYGEVDEDIVQDSFLFTLYLLQTFGDEFRPKEFYADKFVDAFLEAFPPEYVSDPEFREVIKDIYVHRALDRFAVGWGFAETTKEWTCFRSIHEFVKKTGFLDEFIKFK